LGGHPLYSGGHGDERSASSDNHEPAFEGRAQRSCNCMFVVVVPDLALSV
jgi:hypothetical protein